MADVAHDASGLASPKPRDIAPQQASRPGSPDSGKLRVFISYSRDDLKFADQLDAALNACGGSHSCQIQTWQASSLLRTLAHRSSGWL
jgi:hypothetical protein